MKKCMGSVSPETSLRGMFSRRKEKIDEGFWLSFFDERNHSFQVDVQTSSGRPFLSPPKKIQKSAPRRPRETSSFAKKNSSRVAQ